MDYKIDKDTKCPIGTLSLAYAVNENFWEPQHLYFVSDREIKEGDWKYCSKTNYITQYVSKASGSIADKCKCCKKIEATTDTSLVLYDTDERKVARMRHIPQIPQSFLKDYVKAKGDIKEVQIETELSDNAEDFIQNQFGSNIQRVKTNKDNTVIIHQSKTYTREDVLSIIKLWSGHLFNSDLEKINPLSPEQFMDSNNL